MHLTVDNTSLDISEGLIAGFFGFLAGIWLLLLALTIVAIIAMWKIFEKAGHEGWKALIPFYNMYILTEISGLNGWLFLLCLIPGIGALIWLIMVAINLAAAFGKETAFAIGLIILPFIFELILGFGDAEYQLGDTAKATAGADGTKKTTAKKTTAKKKDDWVEGN